jgi:hypothetical protein
MSVRCPKCDFELEVQEADPDVGIMSAACAYCESCDLVVDVESEHHDDDVGIGSAASDRPIGTPISELSGRPGHDGYLAFKRIAKSWGFD